MRKEALCKQADSLPRGTARVKTVLKYDERGTNSTGRGKAFRGINTHRATTSANSRNSSAHAGQFLPRGRLRRRGRVRLGVPICARAWLPKRLPAAHAAAAAGPTGLGLTRRRSALLWRAWRGRGGGRVKLRPATRGVCSQGCLTIGGCIRGRICGACRRAADEDPSLPEGERSMSTQMHPDAG